MTSVKMTYVISLDFLMFLLCSFQRTKMVGLSRLELLTSRLSGVRSNQLGYRPIIRRKSKIFASNFVMSSNSAVDVLFGMTPFNLPSFLVIHQSFCLVQPISGYTR